MQSLYQQYRPKTLNEVAGQEQAVKQIQAVARRGLAGRAFWIVGSSGTGKSTLAAILAREVADDYYTQELDATGINLAELDDIDQTMRFYATGKGGRAFIVNEAHGLKSAIVRRLLVMLEALPAHVIFIFTTTREGQDKLFDGTDDTAPLISRCIRLSLNDAPRQQFADRVQQIAITEGLDGQPISAYLALADDCKCNMRAMLQAVESGSMLSEYKATGAAIAHQAESDQIAAVRARLAATMKAGGK